MVLLLVSSGATAAIRRAWHGVRVAAGPDGPRAVGGAVRAAQAGAVARADAAAAETAGGPFQGQPLREAVVRHQAGDGARAGAAVGAAVGGLPVAAAVAGAVVLPQLHLRQQTGSGQWLQQLAMAATNHMLEPLGGTELLRQ